MSTCYMPGPGAMTENTASVPVIQEFAVIWERETDEQKHQCDETHTTRLEGNEEWRGGYQGRRILKMDS